MPELKCTVQTCMHNKDFYCALDKSRWEAHPQRMQRRHAATALRKEKDPHRILMEIPPDRQHLHAAA